MPKPVIHLGASLPPLWYLYRRGEKAATAAFLLGAVLVDADHLVDAAYFWRTHRDDRQFVPLHSFELLIMGIPGLLASTWGIGSLRALWAGVMFHYMLDWLAGAYRFADLWLLVRATRRFRHPSPEKSGWMTQPLLRWFV